MGSAVAQLRRRRRASEPRWRVSGASAPSKIWAQPGSRGRLPNRHQGKQFAIFSFVLKYRTSPAKNLKNGRRWLRVRSPADNKKSVRQKDNVRRYLGYGAVDADIVLDCADDRATLWAVGNLQKGESHTFWVPLPAVMSGKAQLHELSATIAWFAPPRIGTASYRGVRLKLVEPTDTAKTFAVKAASEQPDTNQAHRGTVIHRRWAGKKAAALGAEASFELMVQREPDEIDDPIPYAAIITGQCRESQKCTPRCENVWPSNQGCQCRSSYQCVLPRSPQTSRRQVQPATAARSPALPAFTFDLRPRFGQSARTPLEEGTRLKLAERPRLIETHRYPLRRQRQVGLGGCDAADDRPLFQGVTTRTDDGGDRRVGCDVDGVGRRLRRTKSGLGLTLSDIPRP
jgi:hypothetical protein